MPKRTDAVVLEAVCVLPDGASDRTTEREFEVEWKRAGDRVRVAVVRPNQGRIGNDVPPR